MADALIQLAGKMPMDLARRTHLTIQQAADILRYLDGILEGGRTGATWCVVRVAAGVQGELVFRIEDREGANAVRCDSLAVQGCGVRVKRLAAPAEEVRPTR